MGIFQRVRLRPTQLRTVADRRYDDAATLCKTGKNARANGAMYLGGFVMECLLKAQLLAEYPWLETAGSPEGRSRNDRHLWSLCYRSHDLDEILAKLPKILERLSRVEQGGSNRLVQSLKGICSRWTIYARYSPHTADIHEARVFLEQVRELKQWLR